MPPHQKAETGNDNRVHTRSTNANKHPGADAQAALRANKPRRAPEVVQREKDNQRAKREEKTKEKLEENVRQAAMEHELEKYRAQQEVDVENEGTAFPRHQPRGSKPVPSKVKKAAPSSNHPAAVEVTTSTNNNGKKRKNEPYIVPVSDDEEIDAPTKKVKTNPPQAQRPAPHPTAKKRTSDQMSVTPLVQTPVQNKVKTTKSPRPLRRTETLIRMKGFKVLIGRPKTSRDNPQPEEVLVDTEFIETTPGQQDFQPIENLVIDMDKEDARPFETPVALKKRKKRALPASESEDETSEENKTKQVNKKNNKDSATSRQQSTFGTATLEAPNSSRSAPTSHVASNAYPAPRTTALNNVKAVTKGATVQSKIKQSGKAKTETKVDSGSVIVDRISDEDDSHERQVAMESPEKGAEARKSMKTQIKTIRKDSLIPLLKEAELRFSTIVLPIFIGKYFADGNGWETSSVIYLSMLQDICDRVYGQELRLKITEDTEAWKKATQTQLWDYRNRMKMRAIQAVEEGFIAVYGEEALKDEKKRIEYGKSLCTKGDHKFTFRIINPNGKRKAQFESKLIIETLSVHFAFAMSKKKLPNFEVGDPEVALALATAAVERALVLWRDNHLEYDRNTLKHHRTTSAQDFSGTNYKSITLGWLERIREKRKKDNKFFVKVCNEARDHYSSTTGKGKVSASGSADKHSDCEIEERVGVMSDDSDDSDEADESANEDGNKDITPGGMDADECDSGSDVEMNDMYVGDSYEDEPGENGDGHEEGSELD